MPFISVLGKPNKELTVHEAMEFHSRLYFMPGLPTPLIFNGQVSPGFGTCRYNCTLSLKLVLYFPSKLR